MRQYVLTIKYGALSTRLYVDNVLVYMQYIGLINQHINFGRVCDIIPVRG